MKRIAVSALVLVALGTAPAYAQSPAGDSGLAQGIRQVNEGDFEGALLTLDAAARALAAQPGRAKELAQAYVYLGVAYVGLKQENVAKAKFRQALAQDKGLRLSKEEFPPKVLRVFEAAVQAEQTTVAHTKEAKRKRGKGGLIVLGAGGLAAGGLALALTRERANRPPTASIAISPAGTALAGATRVTFTAIASDPDGEPLSYTWDLGEFGGGPTFEGPSVTHVYRPGSFTVRLTVRDGLTSTQVEAQVVARDLIGVWRPTGALFRDSQGHTATSFEVSNWTNATFAVSAVLDTGERTRTQHNGTVQDPRIVAFEYSETTTGDPLCAFSFQGQADSNIQTLSGSLSCRQPPGGPGQPRCPCSNQQMPVTLNRQ